MTNSSFNATKKDLDCLLNLYTQQLQVEARIKLRNKRAELIHELFGMTDEQYFGHISANLKKEAQAKPNKEQKEKFLKNKL